MNLSLLTVALWGLCQLLNRWAISRWGVINSRATASLWKQIERGNQIQVMLTLLRQGILLGGAGLIATGLLGTQPLWVRFLCIGTGLHVWLVAILLQNSFFCRICWSLFPPLGQYLFERLQPYLPRSRKHRDLRWAASDSRIRTSPAVRSHLRKSADTEVLTQLLEDLEQSDLDVVLRKLHQQRPGKAYQTLDQQGRNLWRKLRTATISDLLCSPHPGVRRLALRASRWSQAGDDTQPT